MPAVKTTKEDAVAAITEVFRSYGYDGASLSRLSQASGLGRSSLYHYFPNGKEDMAKAAGEHIANIVMETVIEPLEGAGSLDGRLGKAIAALSKLYDGGKTSCLVDLFAIGEAQTVLPGLAKSMIDALSVAFQRVAEEAGAARKDAKLRAERAVIEIEGALVVARAQGSGAVFQRALARIPSLLLENQA
ncbi:MAG: TetR/AcrR family transcriptional regulator [Pseudomonadota bacterium]